MVIDHDPKAVEPARDCQAEAKDARISVIRSKGSRRPVGREGAGRACRSQAPGRRVAALARHEQAERGRWFDAHQDGLVTNLELEQRREQSLSPLSAPKTHPCSELPAPSSSRVTVLAQDRTGPRDSAELDMASILNKAQRNLGLDTPTRS